MLLTWSNMEQNLSIRSNGGSRQAFLRRQPRTLELWQSLPLSSKLFLMCTLAYAVVATVFASAEFSSVSVGWGSCQLSRAAWPGLCMGTALVLPVSGERASAWMAFRLWMKEHNM